MGKRITNPIGVVITEINGVHTVRGDYGIESEGVHARRHITMSEGFTLTEQTINDIHEQFVAAVNAKEGTTGDPTPEVLPEPE